MDSILPFSLFAATEIWNDTDRAMETFQSCLQGRKLHLGMNHPGKHVFSKLDCYNFLLRFIGRFFLRSVVVYQNIDVAQVLYHLASLHALKNENKNVMSCLKECLRVRTNIFGRNSLIVGDTLMKIGDAFKVQEKADEALHSYEEAIEIFRICCGNEYIKVAHSLCKVGYVYSQIKNYSKVIDTLEEADKIYREKLSSEPRPSDISKHELDEDYLEYSSCLFLLGTTHDLLGGSVKAARIYNRVSQTSKQN